MEAAHYQLWERCRAFVGEVCADRDASHGLSHMEKVTENAVLLLHMQHGPLTDLPLAMSRVIVVAMLHDVADHKYDAAGTLVQRVWDFVAAEAVAVAAAAENVCDASRHAVTAMEAVSYSKEKSRGRRWFETELPTDWVLVRDIVSDADKLEAIGDEGMRRCLLYTSQRLLAKNGQVWDAVLQQRCLEEVREHFEEKLSLLATEFIVSTAGKFLAGPRHEEMVQILHQWEQHGLPALS
ncbi:HD superfamily hydrolase [Trypanosoma grayi]|uniref:HD superfamily hydrolase n=1 Tax=Trypanosoma grayi TaxID=71804 RepID=UPI0004F4B462|nr:HD superfamily hydrolase [Trypanosoma grayi]KEG13979.1 HD superfamily hydrolase [Trypanosoma grayi]